MLAHKDILRLRSDFFKRLFGLKTSNGTDGGLCLKHHSFLTKFQKYAVRLIRNNSSSREIRAFEI